MNVYECIVILNPSLSDEDRESAIQRISGIITKGGGEILKTEPWGIRKLSYEINKQNRGFYVLSLFRAPSAVIKPLEELFKVFDAVVKFMVIRLEKKQTEHVLSSLAAEAPQAEKTEGEEQSVQ